MPDLLQTGAAWLHAKLSASASHPVTYRRGAQEVEAAATIGRTLFRVDDGGMPLRVETRDFMVDAAAIALFGIPEKADQISETIDGTTVIYEVFAPGGEPEWRWSGPERTRFRIHTQRISEQA
jgi:hypothetical protein